MNYQTEFLGTLAVSTPTESRFFRPRDTGTLLAISAQAVNAIRNAQLSEQREEAYAELQRMDKLKDEFLVTASHELRTPLSAISGYASLLKRQSARITPQQCLRFATKIAGAAQQLSDLVSNMTEAARMGAVEKKLVFDLEAVQVLSAAEMAANMLVLSIEQRITLDVDAGLWVRAAATHLRQVISNLLENAAKYSPAQGAIHLSASTMTLAQLLPILPTNQSDYLIPVDTQLVLVRVQDQGEGILPQDQQLIFEKFVRAPRSLTTPVRGSGLGLYICRRYVEAMGGKLWLEKSIPNEGSVFSFYLPYINPPVEIRARDGEQESI
jgi:signal transduction histidine kinase